MQWVILFVANPTPYCSLECFDCLPCQMDFLLSPIHVFWKDFFGMKVTQVRIWVFIFFAFLLFFLLSYVKIIFKPDCSCYPLMLFLLTLEQDYLLIVLLYFPKVLPPQHTSRHYKRSESWELVNYIEKDLTVQFVDHNMVGCNAFRPVLDVVFVVPTGFQLVLRPHIEQNLEIAKPRALF